jgi:hypothetical protein
MTQYSTQAFTLKKEGDDVFTRIGEALDSIDNQQLTSDSRIPVARSQQQVNGSLGNHNQLTSCSSEPLLSSDVSGTKPCQDSDGNESQIPSELITSCVSTLLMIQVIWRLWFNINGLKMQSLVLCVCVLWDFEKLASKCIAIILVQWDIISFFGLNAMLMAITWFLNLFTAYKISFLGLLVMVAHCCHFFQNYFSSAKIYSYKNLLC